MLSTPERSHLHSPPRQRADEGGYRVGRLPTTLVAIEQSDVSVAVWRRALPPGVVAALGHWADERSPAYDAVIDPGEWSCERATRALDDGVAATWLHADIDQLLALFTTLAGAPRVRVTLRAVRTDACRKFHVDFVRMRLITTYVGPGTEWVSARGVRREVLVEPPACPSAANRAIVRDRRSVHRARAGDVLILKGERHSPGDGAVHRSPPIEAAGISRLVLTLTDASSS